MCFHPASEAAAGRLANEAVRTRQLSFARSVVRASQDFYGWLMNYDRETAQPKVIEAVKPKEVTGKPGMKVVKEAVKEAQKVPAPVKRSKEPIKERGVA